MSDFRDLPEWIWPLLDTISDYEDEHPILYRVDITGAYERADCFGSYLSDRNAWPPRDVQDAAAFRRHVLRLAAADKAEPEATQ